MQGFVGQEGAGRRRGDAQSGTKLREILMESREKEPPRPQEGWHEQGVMPEPGAPLQGQGRRGVRLPWSLREPGLAGTRMLGLVFLQGTLGKLRVCHDLQNLKMLPVLARRPLLAWKVEAGINHWVLSRHWGTATATTIPQEQHKASLQSRDLPQV